KLTPAHFQDLKKPSFGSGQSYPGAVNVRAYRNGEHADFACAPIRSWYQYDITLIPEGRVFMAALPLASTQERRAASASGGLMLLLLFILLGLAAWELFDLINSDSPVAGVLMGVAFLAFILVASGFFTLQPNEAAALTLFDNY